MSDVDPDSRKWSEWDRDTIRTELTTTQTGNALVISAYQLEVVARLEARIDKDTIYVNSITVIPRVTLKKKGLFSKAKTVPGRNRGYGTMLIRGLMSFARSHGISTMIGGVRAEDLEENRYVLEWYSRRGFIIERVPAPHMPKSVATIRMLS